MHKMVTKRDISDGMVSGPAMNVLYLLLFVILFVITIYLLYVGMSRGLDLFFSSDGNDGVKGVKEDDGKNKAENSEKVEKFANISFNELLMQFNDDGEYIGSGDGDDGDADEDPVVVDHPKNREVKEREKGEKGGKEESDQGSSSKTDPMKREGGESKEIIVFCVDKSEQGKKDYRYTILNDKSLRYLDVMGYQDGGVVLQVKDVKKREITKIKNKIYNKYDFIYQTRDDSNPVTYHAEYRPNQERFMKVCTESEDKALYLEKIQSRDGENKSDRYGAFPLYNIYEFSEKIGMVYLIENQSDRSKRKYAIVVNPEKQGCVNLLAFALCLYLALSRDD